jgi:hypothetical protein
MTDARARETDESHGVHAASREDGGPQEDPAPDVEPDVEDWAEKVEPGGEATS